MFFKFGECLVWNKSWEICVKYLKLAVIFNYLLKSKISMNLISYQTILSVIFYQHSYCYYLYISFLLLFSPFHFQTLLDRSYPNFLLYYSYVHNSLALIFSFDIILFLTYFIWSIFFLFNLLYIFLCLLQAYWVLFLFVLSKSVSCLFDSISLQISLFWFLMWLFVCFSP